MEDTELRELLRDIESDRVERKESLSDKDRICEAICAFANDLPNHGCEGVVFIGARDDGSCANIDITDKLLLGLADLRDNGNIQPFPTMAVQKRVIDGCELAVVTVEPSLSPPIRFRGRVWIRVGPRRAIATREEERRLTEKRRSGDIPYDVTPIREATLDDLNEDFFLKGYLPLAISAETLEENNRSVLQQYQSLRFVSVSEESPTVLGVLTVGIDPTEHIAGSYIQFLRIDGTGLADPIIDEKRIDGPLVEILNEADEVVRAHIRTSVDITVGDIEVTRPDYPLVAIQQIVRNAVMHRNYEGTRAPVKIIWFADRIEVWSPGGPYGQVTTGNFGQEGITDYRNPNIADVFKALGYVQKFGAGIPTARRALEQNGNPELHFEVNDQFVLATLRPRL